jgi:hypothetical protein
MYSQKEHEHLHRLACDWAQQEEEVILAHGVPLAGKQLAIAQQLGVREPAQVRVLAVPEIPLPEDAVLRAATLKTNIVSRTCRGIAIGYGVMLRADSWTDSELLIHQLVHVAQHERAGGIGPFLTEYFKERLNTSSFGAGPLEQEARNVAREISAATN